MQLEVDNLRVFAEKHRNPLKRYLSSKKTAAPVLNGITNLFSGGVNLIVGPNRAGKSILLRVLAGEVPVASGQIRIDGVAVQSAALRRLIGYLPQQFGCYPQFNAREILHYIALLKGLTDPGSREQEVETVLQQTDLLNVAQRQIGKYSQGMLQRVGIAQALLGNPPILILDDPTAGIDPEARNRFRGKMTELGRNRIILWASSVVADTAYADRVLVMDRGERRFWGTPAELAAAGVHRIVSRSLETGGQIEWLRKLEAGYCAILGCREEP